MSTVPPPRVVVGLSGNAAASDSPVRAFLKSPRTLIAAGTPIEWNRADGVVIAEAEIAVLIGARAHRLSADSGADVIAGWAVANDVTAVERIGSGGYLQEAKGGVGFTPIGAWHAAPPATNARAEVEIDGRVAASASADILRLDAVRAVEWVSSFMVLDAGDVVLTGSLAVAAIEPGAAVTVRIEGLGEVTNPTIAS